MITILDAYVVATGELGLGNGCVGIAKITR